MKKLIPLVFLACSAAWAQSRPPSVPPTLQAKVVDAWTVVVQGKGFPDGRLTVSADEDQPHGSPACRAQFSRAVVAKGGAFEVTLAPGKGTRCSFQCGSEPSGFDVHVEWKGKYLAEAKVPCVKGP